VVLWPSTQPCMTKKKRGGSSKQIASRPVCNGKTAGIPTAARDWLRVREGGKKTEKLFRKKRRQKPLTPKPKGWKKKIQNYGPNTPEGGGTGGRNHPYRKFLLGKPR